MAKARLQVLHVNVRPGDISRRGLLYLGLAVGGVVLFYILVALLGGIRVGFGVFVVSALLAIIPVPIFAGLILWLDRHEKEPAWLLLSAFFWGAVAAPTLSVLLTRLVAWLLGVLFGAQWPLQVSASLVAPIAEETAKGLALLALLLLASDEFNNLVDGIVYGALIGLGFAMTENLQLFARAYAAGGLGTAGTEWVIRAVMLGLNHSLWTGVIGAGFGLARESKGMLKWLAPLVAYLAGIYLHTLWLNTAAAIGVGDPARALPFVQILVIVPGMFVVLALPGLVALVALASFGWRREVRIIREELASEKGTGAVTPEELAVLTNAGERWRRSMRVLSQNGPQAWALLRHFYELQVDLAFRKWHASRGEAQPRFQIALTEDAYREHIAQVREQLTAMGIELA